MVWACTKSGGLTMGMEPIRYETRRTSVCAAHDHSGEGEFAAFYRASGRYPDRLGSEEHERTIEEDSDTPFERGALREIG